MLRLGVRPLKGQESGWEGIPGWMERLLRLRGIETLEDARRFLKPELDQLLPPFALSGMEKAVEILKAAQQAGKRIAIYGDYDVDGVCASAILHDAFAMLKLPCQVYIPDRHEEGYGLNVPAVEKLAKECQVLVTVDCGITSLEEVAAARSAGMEVIVTDHHRPGEELPEADAVVSPMIDDYPFPSLCGAGVAWKLATALLNERALPLLELAALATVADMVPLLGENRVIVKLGLERLGRTKRPGLRALMKAAGVEGMISSDQVGFQIAPRMNACGRMESAGTALEMLLTTRMERAEALALKMEELNQERKRQEALVIEEAQAQVDQMDLVDEKAIVVVGEGWNSGVVGLAAGRIAEKYAYPTVALARDGENCVGSARSAGDVDIHLALSQCADLFLRFGGHKQAAGLTIPFEHVEEFRRRFSRAVAEQTGGRAQAAEFLCDGEMTLSQVTAETVGQLSRLEPYGMGNPAPRFLCRGAEALSLRAVGVQGKHLKCTFRQGNDLRDGIFFGGGEWAGAPNGQFQLVMAPTLNVFRGRVSAECFLQAMQLLPETLPYQPEKEALALLDEKRAAEKALPLADAVLDSLMTGSQGTLLVCRTLETALAMHRRCPEADFSLEQARDSRAYHTIMLYGSAEKACASFRHVVLCDGDFGEAAAYRESCPKAQVYALPVTRAAYDLLAESFLSKDQLRNCYRMLREHAPRDLDAWAERTGLSRNRAAFALAVLSEIGLITCSFQPFSLSLLPMVRRDPEESIIYQAAQKAKEEADGVYGV